MLLEASTKLRVSGFSSRGKVRTTNEDSFGLYPEWSLALVSDGIGGHNAGGTASDMVVRLLPGLLKESFGEVQPLDFPAIEGAIRDAVVKLSAKIHQHGRTEAGLWAMGATLVMVLVVADKMVVVWMGDSRAYLMRNRELSLITSDHSMVELLLIEGVISPEQARNHPARSQLSRYLGMPEEVYPDIKTIELVPGDRVLLCSDGLTEELQDSLILTLLSKQVALREICVNLVKAAEETGGRDNITAVIVQWS
jgi:PPM family protein phosphatase